MSRPSHPVGRALDARLTPLLSALVQGYRLLLSPWLGSSCRFTPSCSAYALEALQAHGAWKGSTLTAGRLWRCRPGCPGGHDPVPTAGTHSQDRPWADPANPGSSAS